MGNLLRFVGCSLLMPAPVAAANLLGWPDGLQLPARMIALAAVWALSAVVVWVVWPGADEAVDDAVLAGTALSVDDVHEADAGTRTVDNVSSWPALRPSLA